MYRQLPRVFLHLKNNASEIIEAVKKIPPEEAKYYWDLPFEPTNDQNILEWIKKLISYSRQLLYDSKNLLFTCWEYRFQTKTALLKLKSD